MKGDNSLKEFGEKDVKRFLLGSHFYIISCIVILAYATYVGAPILISILFGAYALYRIVILNIYQTTKKKAWENDMNITEYMNKTRKERDEEY